MTDVAQSLEDLLEELVDVQKSVNKLTTASVSGMPLRICIKDLYKKWLPILGVIEKESLVEAGQLNIVTNDWSHLRKLTDSKSPKSQYKLTIKAIIATTEASILHPFIKNSALQTVGSSLRKLTASILDPALVRYLDESIRCAEANCVRGSVVLAWCAVAFRIHEKLTSMGLPQLEGELDKMRLDQGMMFKQFNRSYKISTKLDVQEIPDAHLILLSRFLTYLDDTEYKHLKSALDLRNGCGHPTGYQPDPVKLQAYFADITQLVLMNSKFG
jgi:hypothetical protein